MPVADFLLDKPDCPNLPSFAAYFFKACGIPSAQRRESTNFPQGEYFKATLATQTLTLSWVDNDYPGFRFWLHLEDATTPDVRWLRDLHAKQSGLNIAEVQSMGHIASEKVVKW